jgi:putative molybdopterin biosynthesis protein
LSGHGHPVPLGHVKPGRAAGTVPAIGVPGYPLAAAVIFELFAAPLIARMLGSQQPHRAAFPARLGCDWTSPPEVEDWVPVSLDSARGALPGKGHGAGSISRLVRADAWWRIPIGQGQFARGDHVDVLRRGD